MVARNFQRVDPLFSELVKNKVTLDEVKITFEKFRAQHGVPNTLPLKSKVKDFIVRYRTFIALQNRKM